MQPPLERGHGEGPVLPVRQRHIDRVEPAGIERRQIGVIVVNAADAVALAQRLRLAVVAGDDRGQRGIAGCATPGMKAAWLIQPAPTTA